MKFTLFGPNGYAREFARPAVMAIVNATPDSFSDGGDVDNREKLNTRINQIIEQGADIIDVGGESTRPGFEKVNTQDEISRVLPVIKVIRSIDQAIPISIDTTKHEVAKAALDSGATFVNDISALADEAMVKIVAEAGCSVVLMRNKPLELDLVNSCSEQMQALIVRATSFGIDKTRLMLDPGLGFGDLQSQDFKALPGGDVSANLELIASCSQYSHGLPVLIGGSRKRFVGELSGVAEAKDRLAGSLAIAHLAFKSGAAIVRAHDISQTVQLRDIVISNM